MVAFKARIKNRAKEKIAEQIADAEKEEEMDRQARLGPGGLDPVEVFESLPDVSSFYTLIFAHILFQLTFFWQALKECFESQDIAKLQETIRNMSDEDARYHMKRCVDSGLWQPAKDDPDTNPEDGFKVRKDTEGDDEEDGDENVYAEVK